MEQDKCTHYEWYNNAEGTKYCIKCNKDLTEELGKLER